LLAHGFSLFSSEEQHLRKYTISKYYNLETLAFSREIHVSRLPVISSIHNTGESVVGGSPEPDAGVTPHGSTAYDSGGRRLFRPLDMAHETINEI